jgi:hypothetical protein
MKFKFVKTIRQASGETTSFILEEEDMNLFGVEKMHDYLVSIGMIEKPPMILRIRKAFGFSPILG